MIYIYIWRRQFEGVLMAEDGELKLSILNLNKEVWYKEVKFKGFLNKVML